MFPLTASSIPPCGWKTPCGFLGIFPREAKHSLLNTGSNRAPQQFPAAAEQTRHFVASELLRVPREEPMDHTELNPNLPGTFLPWFCQIPAKMNRKCSGLRPGWDPLCSEPPFTCQCSPCTQPAMQDETVSFEIPDISQSLERKQDL